MAFPLWRLLLPLIQANQFCMRKDMALHGFFKRSLAGIFQVREPDIQRIKLVKITMRTDRRARSSVTGSSPIVQSLQGSCREVFSSDAPSPFRDVWRDKTCMPHDT
jgi:hypothetical protein